jgi:hypothetical protein
MKFNQLNIHGTQYLRKIRGNVVQPSIQHILIRRTKSDNP